MQTFYKQAFEIRKLVLESLAEAGSGHTGGSLGLADVFAVIYFKILRHNPLNPDWEARDRLVLSIGHVAPVLYATLAFTGYFPVEELKTLRKLDSRLQGHPGRDFGLPGLELSAGSLGQGLSVALGMALADKVDHKSRRTYCILGDGELQEGSVWEAIMAASHHQTDNLCAIVDRNGLQIDGPTEQVMKLESLESRWKAFGWHVIPVDGHDHIALIDAFEMAQKKKRKPTVIIAKTIMGKGVKSIENDYRWHGKAPSKEQLAVFLEELNSSNRYD
ncbi:MAG: transketolase [Bacteroidales bacterium]|nr:transketolase [Bacteroidales bacterium]HOI33135.1 transketolase [Bacteroidales bacterium]